VEWGSLPACLDIHDGGTADSELLCKSFLAKALRDSRLTQFSSHFTVQVIEICHCKEAKPEFQYGQQKEPWLSGKHIYVI
jgi:hypothetical protein